MDKDKAELKQDNPKDETPEDTPAEAKPTPDKEPETLTAAQAKKLAEDAAKRERGRVNKEYEERIKALEEELKERKEAEFASTASIYGLEVEKLKEAGVKEASQIKAYASLFGKTPKTTFKPDSARTIGGTQYSWETVQAMPPRELKKFKSEHGNKDLLTLVKEGVIAEPKVK